MIQYLNNKSIKGSHHLLKAQREVAKNNEEQGSKGNETYAKSFSRIKDGLKVLR